MLSFSFKYINVLFLMLSNIDLICICYIFSSSLLVPDAVPKIIEPFSKLARICKLNKVYIVHSLLKVVSKFQQQQRADLIVVLHCLYSIDDIFHHGQT
jgi:hypothetical protein